MKVNKKTRRIEYDKEPRDDIPTPPSIYEDLLDTPNPIQRTSVPLDLSGAAATKVCLHTQLEAEIVRAFILYPEASSADAGITLEIGKANGTAVDRDYYYTGTSEVSKAIWYVKDITGSLLKKDIVAGDTLTFYSAGSKTGTGEVMLVIEYKLKGIYNG